MTKPENTVSSEESALKFDPETIADLDPENEAPDVQGGFLRNSHETCV
jgi:hypothetical protein